MVDVESKVVEQNEIVVTEKVYKTKDYVRRAKQKYEHKKYIEDPEYRDKRLESIKKSHQKNADKYREYSRLYMREYRAKKKLEKANGNPNVDANVDVEKNITPDNKPDDDMTTKLLELKV